MWMTSIRFLTDLSYICRGFLTKILFFLLVSFPVCSYAQVDMGSDGYRRFLKSSAETVVENIKRRLYHQLDSNERQVVRSILFSFSPSWNFNAYAYQVNGRRMVRIDHGYLSVIDQLSLAYVVEHELGYEGCYKDFVDRLSEALEENSRSIQEHRRPSHTVNTVFALGNESGSDCYGVSPLEFQLFPEAGVYYAGGVEGSLVFIVLHEIAHHILGHVAQTGQELSLQESRQHETEADAWAFSKALDIQVSPVAGISSWIFLSMLDGEDLSRERHRTHPLNVRRFKRMLEEISGSAEEGLYLDVFGNPLPVEFANLMENAIEDLEYILNR